MPDKLSEFLNYAHNMGFDTSYISREKCEPADFSALLDAAYERELSIPLSYAMLRSMSKAKYSAERMDHFGLGLKKYCHFTSPIRRLSDLATHRIIHKVLIDGKRPELYASYAKRAAAAATEAELRALFAERRIENLYKVIYMQGKIGEIFDATVSSVTAFGLFCMPENTCEGLVPISELPGSFVFDEKNLTLRSRDVIYRLGDNVKVRLEEADIIRGKLRYSIV
jgi:ribonuclease R